ncbi:hypothetical protein MHA02_12120 [Methylobacterium haplocladii]|uniref:ATPase AAA-type core domain-containing protein n=1 Tax=Methylobacterium haplocladii TaxID=1176176 RepID=A0A512IM92_9HYPH|nr:hypothetical protein MHA02_12120 [Methylobacterium haplocladii]
MAVAGPPGSGKTTLSRALAERLGAPVLSYDAYEEITGWPPERVSAWMARGAPLDEIPVPGLAADLARLRNGEPVRDREGGRMLRLNGTVAGRPVIVFDTLLGRAHAGTGPLIDHLIWLDLPLDVALARKLRSFTGEARRDPSGAPGLLHALDAYLCRYDALLHPTYLLQRDRVRPGADKILGLGTLADHLAEALGALTALVAPAASPSEPH